VLAEGLGSYAASAHVWPDGVAVGIEINATHHRSTRSGWVTGVCTPIHLGRTVATYEIVITDEQDRRICTARLTCVIRPADAAGES
jgi:1,4-dihydroxy-2-naphthoyl-CoA hydrolase